MSDLEVVNGPLKTLSRTNVSQILWVSRSCFFGGYVSRSLDFYTKLSWSLDIL